MFDQEFFLGFFFGGAAGAFRQRFGFEVRFQLGFREERRQFDRDAVERGEVRPSGRIVSLSLASRS